MRRWLRRIGIAVGAFAALAVVVYIAGEVYQRRDYLPYFVEQKGELDSVREVSIEESADSTTYHLELRDDRGLLVEALMRVPSEDSGPRPVVLILGGVGTGKRTLEYLGPSSAILMALDYPYHGEKEGLSTWGFLRRLPEMRQAMLDTVPASMMALDYLWQREDVDRERILLAGGSFGALFAPAVAAAEPRVTAVAIFFGAGELSSLLRANLDVPAPQRWVLGWIGANVVSPMEPLKYIHRVSPRPLFMLNGTEDQVMPERNCRLLHEHAGEPKSVRRVPLGHVNIRAKEFHQLILDEFLDWLVEIRFVAPEEADTLLQLQP